MQNARLLRFALRANALFSAVSGALALAFSVRVAEKIVLPPWVATLIGAGLVVFSLALVALSARRRVAWVGSVIATALDLGWVIGSAVLLAFHRVESVWMVAVPALIVLWFALLQLEGMRRALFVGGLGRYALERQIKGSADRAWSVVSDVGRFAEVAGTLHRSQVVSGTEMGLVRRCEDTNGVCWLETCTRWESGKAYAFEVDTSAPGYPLPLKTMRGDFEVEPIDAARSVIRVRFTFAARGGWPIEVGLAIVFASRGDTVVGDILLRWAQRIEA